MDLSEKRFFVFGLLVACPEGNPLPDCPLEKYRGGSLKMRHKVSMNFSNEDLDNIIQHHKECLSRRL